MASILAITHPHVVCRVEYHCLFCILLCCCSYTVFPISCPQYMYSNYCFAVTAHFRQRGNISDSRVVTGTVTIDCQRTGVEGDMSFLAPLYSPSQNFPSCLPPLINIATIWCLPCRAFLLWWSGHGWHILCWWCGRRQHGHRQHRSGRRGHLEAEYEAKKEAKAEAGGGNQFVICCQCVSFGPPFFCLLLVWHPVASYLSSVAYRLSGWYKM